MIKIVELFAGVGGFRLAFEQSSDQFKTIWANQWEPNRKNQYAYDCYVTNFGIKHNCVNEDIAKVKHLVPNHDLLVGGFPCQDYSVARTSAKGIEGKKGVLWWDIRDIIERKRPRMVLLENVDRLLKSPANQRGRDFGIILKCFDMLGYNVEWRIINAAEYGHPQKRKRVYIFATSKKLNLYNSDINSVILENGMFAKTHPAKEKQKQNNLALPVDISSYEDLSVIQDNFSYSFQNAGAMLNGKIVTIKTEPLYKGPKKFLRSLLEINAPKTLYLSSLEKWEYLKGSKREERIKPNGEKYFYTEGAVPFPDNIDSPARTMLTSETSINRSTHVIIDPLTNKYRLLTPLECERLNEFPDNWTNTGMPQKFRHFVMGNALVVGVVKTLADYILEIDKNMSKENKAIILEIPEYATA